MAALSAVVQHTRTEEDWLRRDHDSGSLVLAELGVELPLADIFADLDNVLSE